MKTPTQVLHISNCLGHFFVVINLYASIFDPSYREAGDVMWSVRATSSNTYSVQLASKGWYTISLVGPITKMNNTIMITTGVTENIDCRMSLKIIYEEEYSPFIVKPNLF